MWFNSMQREEPYLALTCLESCRDAGVPSGIRTQVLHGCRQLVSRCWVKSRNERNPCPCCQHVMVGTQGRLPVINRRKVGMTSSHHGPYGQGYTCYNGAYRGLQASDSERIPKARRSPDRSSATRLREVGIASNRKSECCGEYVPGPCTHRPSHHGVGCTRSR